MRIIAAERRAGTQAGPYRTVRISLDEGISSAEMEMKTAGPLR
jgi:hypothetical protein